MFDAQQFAHRLTEQRDRWSLLQDFVAEWHGPLADGDGYSAEELDDAERRLGMDLPLALREWYQLAGRREDVAAAQNFLVMPEELEVEDYPGAKALTFYSENQGVVHWGIPLDEIQQEDPPVILDETGALESNSLSEFFLRMVLSETACCSGRLRASGRFNEGMTKEEAREVVERCFVPFRLSAWTSYPSRLYGGPDLLVSVYECGVDIAARSLQALANATELFGFRWSVWIDGEPL